MITLIAHDGETSYGIKQYALDTVDELEKLPKCPMGSTAIVIEGTKVFMMGGDDKWHEL
jgi:hypothetical protein